MYYFLVMIAALLFAIQFYCNQGYCRDMDDSLYSSLNFTFYNSIAVVLIMLFVNRFKISITPISVIFALLYTLNSFVMAYFNLKALAVSNLSVYSVFAMLGGMALPSVLGIVFFDEKLTALKIGCFVLIFAAVLLNIKKGRNTVEAVKYYFLIFILNGLCGVISKLHQSSSAEHSDSASFMFLTGILTVLFSFILILIKYHKFEQLSLRSYIFSFGYGLSTGIGNFILLIALLHIPASVQYPLVTGGTMVFSTLLSAIKKERPTIKEYISAGIAFVATLLMAF